MNTCRHYQSKLRRVGLDHSYSFVPLYRPKGVPIRDFPRQSLSGGFGSANGTMGQCYLENQCRAECSPRDTDHWCAGSLNHATSWLVTEDLALP